MQMFMNKLTVFLQLKVKWCIGRMKVMLSYELIIPLGYTGDIRYDERNLQSNHTPEIEATVCSTC